MKEILKKRKIRVPENEETPPTNRKYVILKKDIDDISFEKQYRKLKSMLALEVNRANYTKLLELIDSCSENARIAGVLLAGAKEAYEDYKSVEYAIWWAKAVRKATEELEDQKRQKLISGQISEEKIKNWIVDNMTREYTKYTRNLNQLKFSVDMMDVLYKQWESRKSLLQTQANVIEKHKTVVITNK
jgi:hypothetical protein